MAASFHDHTDKLISSKKTNIVESKRSRQLPATVFIILCYILQRLVQMLKMTFILYLSFFNCREVIGFPQFCSL